MKASNDINIVDVNGNPISANMFGGGFAGGQRNRDMASWNPGVRSADAELLPDMEAMVGRSHDLHRNYALINGGIRVRTDNVVGAGLRLSAKPMWRELGQTAEWAAKWSRDVESKFYLWANDTDCYCDAGRRMKLGAMTRLAYLQYVLSGETLAVAEWLPDRGGRYATAIKMIDPARLSNPNNLMDTLRLRGGIESDMHDAPIAYNIRSSLQGDLQYAGSKAFEWNRVARETPWGRRQVIHIYDNKRAGQSRGISEIASAIAPAFKLHKLQDTSLESAILNAMYAATIETDFNFAQAADALGHEELSQSLKTVLGASASFSDGNDKHIKMGGAKIPHLFPGERLNFSSLNHPGPNFGDFEYSFIRQLASATGVTSEQVSRDYSKTNYSGARSGLQEVWKFFIVDRTLVSAEFCDQSYALWLEEAIDKGDVELPANAPDFHEAKTAYIRSRWIGPGRGAIDPLKEGKADELELDIDATTLEDLNARKGQDWQEILEQRAVEKAFKEELGLERDDQRGYMAADAPTT